jgi:hypothetical protein
MVYLGLVLAIHRTNCALYLPLNQGLTSLVNKMPFGETRDVTVKIDLFSDKSSL